jgi:hypothetical protein
MAPVKPITPREQLLAAEIFGYSFANHRDHLGIGNDRYGTKVGPFVRN